MFVPKRPSSKAIATVLFAGSALAIGLSAAAPASAQALDIPGLRTGDQVADPNALPSADPGVSRNTAAGSADANGGEANEGDPGAADASAGGGAGSDGTGLDGSDLQNPNPTQPLTPLGAKPDAQAPGTRTQTPPNGPAANAEQDDAGPAPMQVSPPKAKFDLFDGPQNTSGGRVIGGGPLPRQNAVAVAQDGRSETGLVARPVEPQAGNPSASGGVSALLPRNPPLTPGIAGETLAADSLLRTNQRVQALGQLLRRSQDDPFAPVGIRIGKFILYPELIQTLGASTNLDAKRNGASGVFSETTVSSRLLSDWSSNEAEFNTSLTYRRNFAGDKPEDPSATADGRLRLDIDRLTTATLRGAIDYRREDAGDVNDAFQGSQTRPEVLNLSGSGAVAREFGRLTITGTGTIARQAYSNLPDGALDQNLTALTATLRTGYDLSPALAPFVEASLGRRIYDLNNTPGADSIERNSLVPSARVGVALNLAEKLIGEVAIGYAVNRPDDNTLDSHGAPTLDANLVWSPQRGTDVTLAARSTFAPQSDGRSTTVDYETSLGLRHGITARTDLTASVTGRYSDSDQPSNDEFLLTGDLGFNYWLSRYAALTGLYTHRQNFAQQRDQDYTSDTVQLGIRLQR